MKKYLALCLFLIVYLNAESQDNVIKFDLDADSTVMILHTKELNGNSKSKDSLYALSKTWIANTYKNANGVIQVDDNANGHLLGKGTYIFGTGLILKYTIEIFVKDNKYRLYIHNLFFDYGFKVEDFTPDYKEYLALMIKKPKKAHFLYDLRIGGSNDFLRSLEKSLDTFIEGKNDKSAF